MANEKALRLIQLGFQPILLGSAGDDLKHPVLKGWQTAVYTPEEAARWSPRNNLGLRCGRQRDGRVLLVFDFDEEARRVFPAWYYQAAPHLPEPPVVVATARGYHVYFYTTSEERSRTLAGRYETDQRPRRLLKFIETLGRGRQVVSAGSRHPSGRRYRFLGQAGYEAIPTLTDGQYQALVALSQTYDERPAQQEVIAGPRPLALNGHLAGIQNCLEYARRFLGATEQVESNGDIRFLGYGGLLVTADGRGWYSFSDETGGGLVELVAWHQALTREAICLK
ncbi:MAG: bifunctional DNA primase/polymerase [Chloroflexi bacterium]|nr:bifunctional DNA primase/polymerase [Chloroflexota bacterium]MCI0726550.1 bifunctional DNA primase/polymerase [Chloroflexota bacterium]